jgi:hypothetical protein
VRPSATAHARAARATKRTVVHELQAMRDAGQIDRAIYRARRDAYRSFKHAVPHFSGARHADMAGVLGVVDGIAARGDLTPSRLEPLWLTMQRNQQWWNEGPLLASGQRVSFSGSELIWQYVRGEGLQIHPLANFGVLNALWRSHHNRRAHQLLDELLPLAAQRAGGVAWEYYFDFDGGSPPWVSSLAQGTGLQAMARTADRLGELDTVLPTLEQGLDIFRTAPPAGVAEPADGGVHYLQYSFAPGLYILNGFIQSLVGLYDFGQLSGDPSVQPLFDQGETAARAETPKYDTGAWSLYSRGTSKHESDLNYHVVLRDFLDSLCQRTQDPVFCTAERHFTLYLQQPPTLRLVTRRLRAGRRNVLRYRVDKVSRVTLRMRRGGHTVLTSSAVLYRGTHRQTVVPPRRTRHYRVTLKATDLAGNAAHITRGVRVLKPKPRHRKHA